MLKSRLLFKKFQTSRANNSRILRIKNAKFSLMFLYEHKHRGSFSNLLYYTFKHIINKTLQKFILETLRKNSFYSFKYVARTIKTPLKKEIQSSKVQSQDILFEIVRRGPFTMPEKIDSNKCGDDNVAAFVSFVSQIIQKNVFRVDLNSHFTIT